MRNVARLKAGYYPLPQREAERIKNVLIFGGQETAVVDACAGTGATLRLITDGEKTIRHGIELDAYRADESRNILHHVIHGNAFDVQSASNRFQCCTQTRPTTTKWGESQRQNGVPVLGTYLSLAETRRRSGAGDSWRPKMTVTRDGATL